MVKNLESATQTHTKRDSTYFIWKCVQFTLYLLVSVFKTDELISSHARHRDKHTSVYGADCQSYTETPNQFLTLHLFSIILFYNYCRKVMTRTFI